MQAPDGEHVRGVAAADEDDIRAERELTEIVRRPGIEGETGEVAGKLDRIGVLRARGSVDEHTASRGEREDVFPDRQVGESTHADNPP